MDVFAQIPGVVSELAATLAPRDSWIRPIERESVRAKNHAVLFLKPEALAINSGVRVDSILQLLADTLRTYEVEVGAVRVLNGPYLAHYRIMQGHYGVINRVSREGEAALSKQTKDRLVAECNGKDQTILGGHQFIERFPEVSAFALNTLADSLGVKKIASGKYYIQVNVAGERFIVLNPFHSLQLQHFTAPGRAIAVFECWTDTSWKVLRQKMTGATDPSKAAPGSIRRTLYDRKSDFGLRTVGTATNGLHLSAGPLEAMIEFSRFFSDHAKKKTLKLIDTPFGQALAKHGLDSEAIDELADNPFMQSGGQTDYAFNLTEELDSDSAVRVLTTDVSAA